MDNGMYCHIATVFNKITDNDECVYNPTVLTGVFICKTAKVKDNADGVTPASVGKCVIPYDAISSREYVPVLDYLAMSVDEQKTHWTLREGDLIVRGSIMVDGLKANDILMLNDAFQIKSVFDNDFASVKTRMVTGI